MYSKAVATPKKYQQTKRMQIKLYFKTDALSRLCIYPLKQNAAIDILIDCISQAWYRFLQLIARDIYWCMREITQCVSLHVEHYCTRELHTGTGSSYDYSLWRQRRWCHCIPLVTCSLAQWSDWSIQSGLQVHTHPNRNLTHFSWTFFESCKEKAPFRSRPRRKALAFLCQCDSVFQRYSEKVPHFSRSDTRNSELSLTDLSSRHSMDRSAVLNLPFQHSAMGPFPFQAPLTGIPGGLVYCPPMIPAAPAKPPLVTEQQPVADEAEWVIYQAPLYRYPH